MASVVFNGDYVKTLKNKIKIGNGAYIISGTGVPSESAPNGSIFYSDNGKHYRRKGGQWVEQVFSKKDVYFEYDLDNFGEITDWTTVGDVSTSVESTDSLNGNQSAKITFGASVAADDMAILSGLNLSRRSVKSLAHKLSFVYSYTGDKGAVEIALYGNLPSEEIVRFELDPAINKSKTIFVPKFDKTDPNTWQQSLRIIAKDTSAANAEVIIDDIEISDEAYGYGSATISETITYTGFVSRTADIIKLKNKIQSDENILLEDKMATDSRIIILKDCTITATIASSYASALDTYQAVQVKDENDNVVLNSYSDDYSSSIYGDNSTISMKVKKGWYIHHVGGADPEDGHSTFLSVTATAQSDKMLFEDEREQAHVVASLKLEGNDGRAITANTESIPFDGASEFWTAGADGSTPTNGNYYTVQNDSAVVSIDGNIYITSNLDVFVYIMLNGSSYKVISSRTTANLHNFKYISEIGEFSKGDKIAFVTNNTITLSNNANNHYLTITEEYLPPLEQASTPTVLAVNASEENDFKRQTNADGTLSKQNDDWCTVVKEGAGAYKYKLNESKFNDYPYFDSINTAGAQINGTIMLDGDTFPYFHVYTRNNETGAYADALHTIAVSKSGADRSPAKAYCVDGKSVVKEQVMFAHVNSGDTYNVQVGSASGDEIIPIDHLSGDVFGSASNDILTLPEGRYMIKIPASGYGDTGWCSVRIKDSAFSTTIKEILNIFESEGYNDIKFTEGKFYIDLSDTTSITFGISQTNTAYKYAGTIEIRKLL